MSDNSNTNGGGNAGLAFIVGGVVVLLAIIAYIVFSGDGLSPEPKAVTVDVNLPDVDAPALPPVEPPTLPGPGPSN